ncbi:hypothetical protein [Haloferax volcanii]|uniref:Uncharacterized protein n=3 Tax=Haloferax volcanii TaxID=2246 RepID=D4GXK3_HALVD|nr:hypothetical protein [Haloferax volcanii]ADE02897.1 uncharacterized protein HVO_1334 [Haloferax volcanii DS2]ELY27979.1 hypothetical protein C498_12068 [Haloferax volcanii DS2]MBS8117772.1 hypothetical protein [Haloferax volcanii]MBS8122784.1 hypothetical protein [Haloferax volcanii]MBS8126652.1 hypothetical protein [Haloferax volcanii]
MSPKRAYWLAFVVFGLSAAVGVALDLATGAADIGTAAAAAGAVTVIYGAVVALRDPDRARFPSDWGPLEHGVAAAGLYTVGIAFQLYAVVT